MGSTGKLIFLCIPEQTHQKNIFFLFIFLVCQFSKGTKKPLNKKSFFYAA
jgi:hypothetical protein